MQTPLVRSTTWKFRETRFFLLCLVTVFLGATSWCASAANFYAGTSPANVPWPGGIVPYEFTNTLTAAQTNTYLNALREWELAANVKFVPHTNQTRWILFSYNTNFLDFVSGGSYNPQLVTVSSLSRAQVCHEMGHSFGFNHENIRVDATNYIAVLTNNITDEPDNLHWFIPDSTTVTNGKYDYESVMHLGWDFDSTNPGVLATQQPRPPNFPRYQFRMGNFCLSPGDRAALAYLYGPPAVPLTNIVTTTADAGTGSLRAAMYYVTDHPGSIVKFNIPTSDAGYSNGVFTIHLTGQLPTIAANGMIIDGSTQPGFTGKPLIVVDGSQIIPETFTSDTLLIYSANNQIKNISLQGFNWNGITLEYADATNNTISGCWLGLNSAGNGAASNALQGILFVQGADHNIIGGTNALARNVISGNGQYGIWMSDTNIAGNVILGNYIGTDASGSFAVPNLFGGIGIFTNGNGNIIGGTNSGAGNVISGNVGANIFLSGANVSNNIVEGNYIGLNAAGSAAITNLADGIYLTAGANGNIIGGTNANARNVISGNEQYGIFISDAGTSNNFVLGNFIGPDFTGTNAVGQGGLDGGFGVGILNGASGNFIGGAGAGAGNLISGNPNFSYGIAVMSANSNAIQGNFIGTDFSGKKALANGFAGIILEFGSSGNLIGGTAAGAGNVISANGSYGIYIYFTGTTNNLIQGNIIGADVTGTNALGNGFANVVLLGGATGNFIGGTGAGAGNIVAFAGGPGVTVYDAGTTNNSIRGNSIFSSGRIGIDLVDAANAPPYVTLNDTGDADTGPNNLQNFPVITNAFGLAGSTIVLGKLNSLANKTFSIDLYRNIVTNSTGYGEGRFYLGTVNATTDGSGNAKFAFTNNTANYSGQYISTTATDTNGNTSEFSADVLATNLPAAFVQSIGNFLWNAGGFKFTLNLETNFNYRIQTTTNLANSASWVDLTNFLATNSIFNFTDSRATNKTRLYRVVSP
jgi:Astacin (Peptidase family M12A)